ncbi:hypothetical protein HPP92_022980 [Vanilla planifolia]|uniref:Uncharacterized protein n=1 Tax=Vanilla planifolia TaxID=51239 RepID=A0A835PVQ0_VANPL|nr:hypothetical protein HPP92_023245 [Vanilla planifolia]KAG0459852.1 hypothetical protein HPP92_022980 [Vanilla planifolia]
MSEEKGKLFQRDCLFDPYSSYFFDSGGNSNCSEMLGIEAAASAAPPPFVGFSDYMHSSDVVDYGGILAKDFDVKCCSSVPSDLGLVGDRKKGSNQSRESRLRRGLDRVA